MEQEYTKNRCKIECLSTSDRIAIGLTAITSVIVSIAILAGLLYAGFQVINIIKENIDLLLSSNPPFTVCVYVSFYIFIFIIGILWAIGLFLPSFTSVNQMIVGSLYKVSFYNDNAFIGKSYKTLSEIENMGYNIKYNNQEENKDE